MAKEKEVTPIQKAQFNFRLEDIQVGNFSINMPAEDIDPHSISLEFASNFTFDLENEIATCIAHFKHFIPQVIPENKPKTIMHIDIAYFFKVHELSKFVKESKGKQGLQSPVHIALLSVAFSTSRGIIYERTKGYDINKILIPVMNPREFEIEVVE